MRSSFYFRLAWSGMVKNRRLYLPYILSCIGTVMMLYIMNSLSCSPVLKEMKGGGNMGLILSLGKFVIAVFALIFLFYTNSFLIRRRYREFGLYNVLGMEKSGICRIVFMENTIVSLLSMAAGIGFGIAFSKLAELALLNAIHKDIDYHFSVKSEAVLFSAGIFAVIFFLILLRSLWQVLRSNPLELIRSENVGEKAPKGNWVMALLGAILLGAAYYLAVSIESPLSALIIFFAAVIMVIIATYMLFISGSVVFCRLLQKNKKYYYQKNHFVSVSSMVYRMKRNGAGLASICILSTMVLVIISSTSSLYIGANDSLKTRYPQENNLSVFMNSIDNLSDDRVEELNSAYDAVFEKWDVVPENITHFRYASIVGLLEDEVIEPDSSDYINDIIPYDNLRSLYFISAEDYNENMGTDIVLLPGETMVCTLRCKYDRPTLSIGDLNLNVIGNVEQFVQIGEPNAMVVPSIFFVIPDYETLRPLEDLVNQYGDQLLDLASYIGYDLDAEDDTVISVFNDVVNCMFNMDFLKNENGFSYSSGCVAKETDAFYVTFGGLFFIGIMLSIVFIFAAVLIIYYKQICEGYEDQSRFDIMQKVGMSKRDIRKSIDSQVLIVFFAPLIMAGLHLGFAFPLVWKILQLFNLRNLKLVIMITSGAFALFGVFYTLVYRLTSSAYYSIVSNSK